MVLAQAGCTLGGGRSDAARAPVGPLDVPPSGPASRAPDAGTPTVAPRGIYFLHERDFGLSNCVFIAERTTGGAPEGYRRGGEGDRSRAVLELAEEARWMGGNVVMLPKFSEDFRAGRLSGRVYRCPEPQRRSIYQRAAAEQRLTVVP
jgi:hypothetical protein